MKASVSRFCGSSLPIWLVKWNIIGPFDRWCLLRWFPCATSPSPRDRVLSRLTAVGHTEEDRQACSGPMARSHGIVIGGGAKRERLLGKRPRRAAARRIWGFDICEVCRTEYGPSYYFALLLGLADFPPSRFSTVAFDSVGDALFEGW